MMYQNPSKRGQFSSGTEKYLPNLPVITIITVVFNRVHELEKTIQSVCNLSYKNVEYIIVDGGSTDGTLDTIEKYLDNIDCYISEPDKGIYDAMNKGIELATGDWVNFMNAGDVFYSEKSLNLFNDTDYDVDLIYGDAIIEYPTFRTDFVKSPLDQMWKNMPFCHQSCFARTQLLKDYKFDLTYKLSSDFDFIYKAHNANKKILYVNHLICLFDYKESASKKNALKSVMERRNIVLKQNFSLTRSLYYNYKLSYIYMTMALKKLIGKKMTECITSWLRH